MYYPVNDAPLEVAMEAESAPSLFAYATSKIYRVFAQTMWSTKELIIFLQGKKPQTQQIKPNPGMQCNQPQYTETLPTTFTSSRLATQPTANVQIAPSCKRSNCRIQEVICKE